MDSSEINKQAHEIARILDGMDCSEVLNMEVESDESNAAMEHIAGLLKTWLDSYDALAADKKYDNAVNQMKAILFGLYIYEFESDIPLSDWGGNCIRLIFQGLLHRAKTDMEDAKYSRKLDDFIADNCKRWGQKTEKDATE